MFERILMPTDFSEGSERALLVAQRIARVWDSTIHFVHVDEEHALGMHSSDDLIRFMNEVDARRKEWMEKTTADLEEAGLKVELRRLDGLASEQILEYAESSEMGLIVMGTTGHTPLEYLLLGSTSIAVLRHAHCPVLTVATKTPPEEPWEVRRVLFPTDFSKASVAGLGLVAEVARKLGASLQLLHVLKAPTYIPAIPGEPPFYVSRQAFSTASARATADLAVMAERAELEGLDVDWGVTLSGDTSEGIASWAKEHDCDLVILPRHGRGAIRSILFGRVVEHAVKRCSVPVLSFHP